MDIDTRLVSYLRRHRERGYSENVLKAHLMKQGYPLSVVNEAMRRASVRGGPHGNLEQLNTQAKGTFHYLKVSGLTVFCIVSFAAMVLFFDTTSPVPLALISVLAVIFGLFSAMTLSKSATSSTAFELGIYMVCSVTSLLLSAVFVFANRMLDLSMDSGEMAAAVDLVFHPMPDPFISGIVFVVLFSLPSLMYYFRWERRNALVFASYLVWAAIYVVVHKVLIPAFF